MNVIFFDQVESWYLRVPSLCQKAGQSSGQFFCARMRGISQNTVVSPPQFGETFSLTEYGCGIRLPTSVGPCRALSEASGRPHQKVDLGVSFLRLDALHGKQIGLRVLRG